MIDIICKSLENSKFSRIQYDNEDINIFYKIIQGVCYTLYVIDYRNPMESTLNEALLKSLDERVKCMFNERGICDVKPLAIVATYSESIAWELLNGIMSFWFCDVYHNEFVIPQNQPKHFLDVEEILQRIAAGEVGWFYEFRKKAFTINNFIVLVNVVVFLILEYVGSTESVDFMLEHGAFYWPAIIDGGEYYRFLTCMFMHFGFEHLFSNMLVLFFLGDNLERAVGKIKYLIIYLCSGLMGGLVSCAYYYLVDEVVVAAGASGAVFGVIGALIYIVWKNRGLLEDLSIRRLAFFVIFSFYSGLTSTDVGNAAHAGGVVMGVILAAILYRLPQKPNVESDEEMY